MKKIIKILPFVLLAISCQKEVSFEKKCKVCVMQLRTVKITYNICGTDTSYIAERVNSDSIYYNCK